MDTTTDIALEPLRQVLKDICAWFPGLENHVMDDFIKLKSLCATRGLYQVLLVELPRAGKHFDSSISNGFIQSSGYPYTLGSVKKGHILFASLYLHVFEGTKSHRSILPDADHRMVFFLRQLLFLYKEIDVPCPPDHIYKAVAEYIEVDEALYDPTLKWNHPHPSSFLEGYDELGVSPLSFTDGLVADSCNTLRKLLETLDYVSLLLGSEVPPLNSEEILPRHGPGAVADLTSGSDKYAFPGWSRKLDHMLPRSYFAYSSEEWARFDVFGDVGSIGPGRLSAVPKTYEKPRLITIEPTANQFLQQGLMRWIRRTLPNPLRRVINFLDQEPSRALALEASQHGRLATVDLSAASDRLSCWVVERCFQDYGGILPYLYASRTETISLGAYVPMREVLLKKFAGMGSAVTFPIQSIAYAMMCISARIVYDRLPFSHSSIVKATEGLRVFGDDLIVPKEILPHLDLLLSELQLKINSGKSHYKGWYRESCGMDAFHGADVTPLHLHAFSPGSSSKSIVAWLDSSNNAHYKGLWNLSSWMDSVLDTVTHRHRLPEIPSFHRPLGCLTRFTFTRSEEPLSGRFRYNPKLFRKEVKGILPRSVARTRRREGPSSLLQYFLEYKPAESFLDSLEDVRTFKAGYLSGSSLKIKTGWVPLH